MSKYKIFLDSFSGSVIDLKRKQRTLLNILITLSDDPMVSTWDMTENKWLQKAIKNLSELSLIHETKCGYPWHKFEVTDIGKQCIKNAKLENKK